MMLFLKALAFMLITNYIYAFQLESSESEAVRGTDFTFTCTTSSQFVVFTASSSPQCLITGTNLDGSCRFGSCTTLFLYSCFPSNGTYTLTIPGSFNNDSYHNTNWTCEDPFGGGSSNMLPLYIKVPISSVTILADKEQITAGENRMFTCTTSLGRPEAKVQWYLGSTNVTSSATQQPACPGACIDQINSTSTYTYTGDVNDLGKTVYCTASNIDGYSVNSKSRVIFINLPVSTITISPEGVNNKVTILSGAQLTFTCTTDSGRPAAWIQWYIGSDNVTYQAIPQTPQPDGNKFISSSALVYTGKDADHNKVVYCEAVNIDGGQKVKSTSRSIYMIVPISTVTISPEGVNNKVIILSGDPLTFTCTTDSGRPAAWIQWYIESDNVTDQATPQTPKPDGNKFISSSTLVYTGKDADHNKVVYCEAVNIDGGQKVKSTSRNIYIIVPVQRVSISPTGTNNRVSVEAGGSQTFKCTTDSGRPAAWIQWYIGSVNVTAQATPQTPQPDGDKFISSSTLVYTGREADHNKVVYCEAVNFDGVQKVRSAEKSINILVPISTIKIVPAGNSSDNKVSIVAGASQEFTCTTDSGRPAAWIQWYIGSINVTDQATPQTPLPDGNKFISSSTLVYTGRDADHNKVVYCEAVNIDGGQKVKSAEKYIDILIPVNGASLIASSGSQSQFTVISGEYQNFICTTSESRPAASVQWYIGTSNKTNDAVTHPTSIGDKFITSSSYTYVGRIIDHQSVIFCTTNNIAGIDTIKSREVAINIHSRVIEDDSYTLSDKIGLKENADLTISIHLIANPQPSMTWEFYPSFLTMNKTITNVGLTCINTFYCESTYFKTNADTGDYGIYKISGQNGIGKEFIHAVTVSATRRPFEPDNITIQCDIRSIDVTWRSGFHGGDEQFFQALIRSDNSQEVVPSEKRRDPGEGKYQNVTVHGLNPSTLYHININASNIHGYTLSDETAVCVTKPDQNALSKEESISFGTGIGIGIGMTVFVVIVAISAYIVLKRFRKTAGTNKDTYEDTQLDTGSRNLYNELGEVKQGSNVHDTTDPRNQYMELNPEIQQNFKKPKIYENTKILTKGPGKTAKMKEDNTYANLKV